MFRQLAACAFAGFCLVPRVFSQTPAKVDFERDVQPIFRQNCIGCHGPAMQNNGLRVDRRSSVLKPGTRRVTPGNSQNSFLYHRVSGSDFGLQMPPTGPLKADQIQTIKTWIEQGAEWPDSLANEIDLPPLNPKAIAMVEMLRTADLKAFDKMVAEDPALLNARGPESSTPFMYAVLYTDAATIERLIKQGADVNKRNDAGATALMWAALDLEKTQVLVAHGADVNTKSEDSRTPLMIAAGKPGGSPTVKFLLAHGAKPNPNSNHSAESSPLLEASIAGDAESMQALLDSGAKFKDLAGFAIASAAGADFAKCIDLLVTRDPDPKQYTIALGPLMVLDNPKLVRLALDHGADVNAQDPTGRTPLMYAAVSDLLPVDQIKMLIDKGANVNAKSQHTQSADSGRTALDIAKAHGNTPVVDLLMKSGGASPAPLSIQPATMRRGNTIQAAVPRSLAVMQRADASFVPKAGCFSCHNQSITAMAVALARKSGFQVDEKIAAQQVQANARALAGARTHLNQGYLIPGINESPAIAGWVLLGLDAEGYKPDLSTDAVSMFIQKHQMADGHWASGPEARPPLCSDLSQTVIAMRSIQLYPPRVDQAAYAKSVQSASTWIGEFRPRTTYDVAWRLLGL